MNSKIFWVISMGFVLTIWICLGVIALAPLAGVSFLARIAFVLLVVTHVLELPIAFAIGREKELKKGRIVFKTLIFGFTWWLPLRKGLIDG